MEDSEKPDQLREHSFDGIQEYDNQLPRWWVNMFLLTTLFGIVYFYLFHIEDSQKSLEQEYVEDRQTHLLRQKIREPKNSNGYSEEELLALVKRPEILEKGRAIFVAKCASCHGDLGQGIVGPNLTDDYWLHGSKMSEIVHTITFGVAEKGMIAWKDILSSDEIHNVAAYIKSIRGSEVANPKKPDGILIKEK